LDDTLPPARTGTAAPASAQASGSLGAPEVPDLIERHTRPLTAADRRALEGHQRAMAGRGEGWFAAVMAAALTGAVQLLVLERVLGEPGNLAQAAALLVATAVGALVYRRVTRPGWRSAGAGLARADLAGGVAEVVRYRARAALHVEELEDEGPSYFLELVDGGVLFLCGQYLYDGVENGSFPCEQMVISRGPQTRLLLDFACAGPKVPVVETFPGVDLDEWAGSSMPDDGEVLERRLEDIRAERRARAGRPAATD
jgi:hypothetical protein